MSPRRPATVPDAAPRAVIYVRQSVSRDESVSLELQETACRDHCRRHGYEVVIVESDPGISGRTFRRPAVTRVMDMVETGRADVIVLWRWSRLSRSRRDWAIAVDRVDVAGGRIESATEPADVSTASGRLHRGMLAEFAAFESERIGEEWKRTQARRISRGLPASGKPRYGYRKEGAHDEQRYVPDPDTGPHLRWMYEQIASGAHGMRGLAHELNRRGILNQHGRAWTNQTVTDLLDSGFGAGLIAVGKRAARTWVPGAQEPVIDQTAWTAYRRARHRLATVPPRVLEPRYVLTGLIRCGDCGASMNPTPSSAKQTGYQYVCSRWRTVRDVRCVTVVRARAERAVLDWLGELAADVDRAAAADAAAARTRTRARTDTKVAARRVAELERQLTELTRQLVAGTVPEAAYRGARDEIETEHATATARLEEAEQAAAPGRPSVRRTATGLLDAWDLMPIAARRQVLATLVARVEVRPPSAGPRTAQITVVPVWDT